MNFGIWQLYLTLGSVAPLATTVLLQGRPCGEADWNGDPISASSSTYGVHGEWRPANLSEETQAIRRSVR